MKVTGTPTVIRGFGLADHLRALPVNKSCYVRAADYTPNVVYVTLSKLRKEGYAYKSKKIRLGKYQPVDRIKVTRIDNDEPYTRTETDCDSNG